MSWEATAYVKGLAACPDGAGLGRGQKLLLFVLADYHNTKYRVAWPSEPLLAQEALSSLAQVKRDLAYLEEHSLIQKLRPQKLGRGWTCAYQFLALDAKDQLNLALSRPKKGAHPEPLFCPEESNSKGVHLDDEKGSEAAQKGFTASNAIRKNEEPEPTPNQEHHASGALKIWFDTKTELQKRLPPDEYKLWAEPARLTRPPMSGTQLLVGLPPNGRIIEAAQRRKEMLTQLLGQPRLWHQFHFLP